MKLTLRNLALSAAFVTASLAVAGAQRAGFAYGLEAVQKADTVYTVSFKASANGTATLVLTDGEKELVKPLGAATKGENAFDVVFNSDETGTYNWSISFESTVESTEPEFVVKDIWVQGENGRGQYGRGGIVTLTDANYDSYGYTLVAASRGIGIDVYDPAGELVHEGLYKATSLNSANSSPLRGGQRFGKAVFASWADSNSGYYYVDPINPASEPENILVGTRASSGLFTYNGVQTAGGSPCVAFLGEGENQTMWLYEEDLFNNDVAVYPIGTDEHLTVAGHTVGLKGATASQNVSFTPTKYGMFIAQNRANLYDTSVPALIFVNEEGQKLAIAPDFIPQGAKVANCNGGFAISADLSLMAVCGYTGIEFYSLEWGEKDGYMVPVKAESLYSVECSVDKSLNNGQAMFDPANNLHYTAATTYNYGTGVRYAVVALPGAHTSVTPAQATLAVEKEYQAPEFYFRGEFNDWDTSLLADMEGPDADGNYTYTVKFDEFLVGDFKFGTADWAISFGADPIRYDVINYVEKGEALDAWENGKNFHLDRDVINAEFKLVMNPDFTQPSKLYATWEEKTVELPELYLRGTFNDWDTSLKADLQGQNEEGYYVYTAKLDEMIPGGLKFGTEDWLISYGAKVDRNLVNGEYVDAVYGSNTNFMMPATAKNVELTLYMNPDTLSYSKLYAVWEEIEVPVYEAPELYLRGEFSNWEALLKADMEGPDADGLYTYTAKVAEMKAGAFKFGTDDWATNFGVSVYLLHVANGEAIDAWENAQDAYLPEDCTDAVFTLVMNPDFSKPSQLTVTWTPKAPEYNVNPYIPNYSKTEVLNIPAGSMSGIQFDVEYPEGVELEISEAALAEMSVEQTWINNYTKRYIAYTNDGETLMADFVFTATAKTAPRSTLKVTNIIKSVNDNPVYESEVKIPVLGYSLSGLMLPNMMAGESDYLPVPEELNYDGLGISWKPYDSELGKLTEDGMFTALGEGTITDLGLTINDPMVSEILDATATLTILGRMGDVNGSGTVDIADVVAVVNYILMRNPEPFNFKRADLDGSGDINIADVTRMVKLVLAQPTASRANSMMRAQVMNDEIKVAGSESIMSDGKQHIYISLDTDREYTAIQLDIEMTGGVRLGKIAAGNGITAHVIDHASVDNNTTRVVLYSMALAQLPAGENLIDLAIDNTDIPEGANMTISSAVSADAEGQAFSHPEVFTSLSNLISGVSSTVVEGVKITTEHNTIAVSAPAEAAVKVIDLQGRTVGEWTGTGSTSVESGLYIVTVTGCAAQKVEVK